MNEDGSEFNSARRKHWLAATGLTLAFVYVPQLAALIFGPLSECGHCVAIYAKVYLIAPGSLLGLFIVSKLPSASAASDFYGFVLPGILSTLILLAGAITITASIRRVPLVLWLAALAMIFPIWFLLFSPVLEQVDNFAVVSPERKNPEQPLPDIVFVLLDELPLATLVDREGLVDASLFPGFARLQSMSDWYFNTISVSDSTGTAVPSILTSRYPGKGRRCARRFRARRTQLCLLRQ